MILRVFFGQPQTLPQCLLRQSHPITVMANMYRVIPILFLASSLVWGQTLEQRIEAVFGNNGSIAQPPPPTNTRAGFDVIVQPDPIVEPTTRPQVITSVEGDNCTCVPYHECDPNTNTINSADNFEIDIRFNPNTCQDVLDVCCMDAQRKEPVQTTTSTASPEVGCGIRNLGGIDFQLLGNVDESGFAEFPWTVALIRISDDACLCGGSLIHPQVILTGSHCVSKVNPGTIKVRAGEWDTQTEKERLPYQERIAKQIITHPNFNSKTLAFDIALIVLEEPFVIDQHINTICLPNESTDSTGRSCVATGWGKDVFGKAGKYSVIMKRVELPVINSNECEDVLKRTRLGPKFRLHDTFICAGGEPGKDTCQGDGGAPLVCAGESNRYYQSGIVSWGIGCKEKWPAVYTDVADFRNWVDVQMMGLGLDTLSYTAAVSQ